MAILSSLSKYSDLGLLIIRLGLGIMFIMHGYPKLTGGPEMWEKIGGAMGNVGINFLPVFWGFLAAFAEAVGGLLFALGLLFRPTAFALAFTMLSIMSMSCIIRSNITDTSVPRGLNCAKRCASINIGFTVRSFTAKKAGLKRSTWPTITFTSCFSLNTFSYFKNASKV